MENLHFYPIHHAVSKVIWNFSTRSWSHLRIKSIFSTPSANVVVWCRCRCCWYIDKIQTSGRFSVHYSIHLRIRPVIDSKVKNDRRIFHSRCVQEYVGIQITDIRWGGIQIDANEWTRIPIGFWHSIRKLTSKALHESQFWRVKCFWIRRILPTKNKNVFANSNSSNALCCAVYTIPRHPIQHYFVRWSCSLSFVAFACESEWCVNVDCIKWRRMWKTERNARHRRIWATLAMNRRGVNDSLMSTNIRMVLCAK